MFQNKNQIKRSYFTANENSSDIATFFLNHRINNKLQRTTTKKLFATVYTSGFICISILLQKL